MSIRKVFGYGLMSVSSIVVLCSLLAILMFIFSNGIGSLSFSMLTTADNYEVGNVVISELHPGDLQYEISTSKVLVSNIDSSLDMDTDLPITSSSQFEITRINNTPVSYFQTTDEIDSLLTSGENVDLKIRLHEEGILSMIISTILLIIISLVVAVPLGVGSAIFLIEYPISTRLDNLIHFAINSLTAIPSIVFGLFGSLFFISVLGLPMSILTGALTISIMLLPVIIRSTEEALLSIPNHLRSASRGLGANEVQTIFKVVIPTAIPGIIVGIILAIGRIIGESAVLVFTAGTFDKLTLNPLNSSSTLTVKAYMLAKEYGDISGAAAIGIVIILIIICLNLVAKSVSKRFEYS